MYKLYFILTVLLSLSFAACNTDFSPKATAYPAIALPQKEYLSNAVHHLPYTFDIPVYAYVDNKVATKGDQQKAGWMNLEFPSLNATVYMSYNSIQKDQSLRQQRCDRSSPACRMGLLQSALRSRTPPSWPRQ